jgi:hypothetical protein
MGLRQLEEVLEFVLRRSLSGISSANLRRKAPAVWRRLVDCNPLSLYFGEFCAKGNRISYVVHSDLR